MYEMVGVGEGVARFLALSDFVCDGILNKAGGNMALWLVKHDDGGSPIQCCAAPSMLHGVHETHFMVIGDNRQWMHVRIDTIYWFTR